MRIRILCEGRSDEDGLKNLFRSSALRFVDSGTALHVRNMKDVATTFRKIGAHVHASIALDGVDEVFALVDLAGSQPYLDGVPTPEAVKAALRHRVSREHRDRFHPHVAVHEIEAWAFADEAALGERLGSRAPSYGEPEKINLTRKVSDRLGELYRTRARIPYKKTIELPKLLAKADPRVLYERCPHFKDFLDDLANATDLSNPFAATT